MKDIRTTSVALASAALGRIAARHPSWVRSVLRSLSSPGDDEFLEDLYLRLLGRPVDQDGRRYYLNALSNGLDRSEIVLALAESDEYKLRCRRGGNVGSDHGPRAKCPDKYRHIPELGLWTLEVTGPDDFDWIEQRILDDGYYEQPGVWTLEVDTDKRLMAEIAASLSEGRVLELGCASGAVLEGLYERGLSFAGIDISEMAIERASDRVRPHIHHGDILSLELDQQFDTVIGLDIFEHLNPNRLAAYIERVRSYMVDGGLLFTNIPAFGRDEVFGEVFPYYLRGWDADAEAGRCFRTLHVDDDGFPVHGHLVWADTTWWVEQFERAGFSRRPAIEHSLHRKYGDYLRAESPARVSFYVFAAGDVQDEEAVIGRIEGSPSDVLCGTAGMSLTAE